MLFIEASTFDHSSHLVAPLSGAKHRQCSEKSEGHFKDTNFSESGLFIRRIVLLSNDFEIENSSCT